MGSERIMSSISIRPMLVSDLSKVLRIQELCYTSVPPESKESLEAKLQACPSTCFVASLHGETVGYLIGLLRRFDHPPELNAATCVVPDSPNCLYLHDLAVSPQVRSAGVGRALVGRFLLAFKESRMRRASLIAVQDSAPYWQRFGFAPVCMSDVIRNKLVTYGTGVVYMEYL